MESLTGRLLVGVPHETSEVQVDELFERAVVLLLHHDETGAQGVILNRPLEARVDAVLPGWQPHVSAPEHVFQGGPVGLDSAIGVVSVPGNSEATGARRLFRSVGVIDLDAPPALVVPQLAGLRIFAGHCGWSAGQVESEIDAGMWWVLDHEIADSFAADPSKLWTDVLRRQPPPLCHAATFPRDVSLN